eukprot:TRINITY_DN10686_c0_g3_i1.p1 TRINITY_DN10686_c0_g3~~TRINITY_DN10686_c0_g3_i1.p1  ORF type:complete len:431 (-),score=24.52 TRINITY_DN10686_c0_g3_i1:26-1318(-)
MVNDAGDAGYYVGYLNSAFYIGRVLTASYWGYITDRYGRRRALLASISLVSLATIAFGLAPNLLLAILSRFAMGLFSGLSTISKTLTTEVSRTHKRRDVALINALSHAGSFVGPFVGGSLVRFDERFPFAKPSLAVASLLGIGLLITKFYFHEKFCRAGSEDNISSPKFGQSEPVSPTKRFIKRSISGSFDNAREWLRLLDVPNVKLLLAINCAYYCLHNQNNSIFPLFLATPSSKGGLGLDSFSIGRVQANAAIFVVLLQCTIYGILNKFITQIKILELGFRVLIPLNLLLPSVSLVIHHLGSLGTELYIVSTIIISNVGYFLINAPSQLLLNESVSGVERGRINGMLSTLSSITMSLAHIIFSKLFAWSVTSGLPFPFNHYFVFALASCACIPLSLPVSYTHLRAHETPEHLVCRLLLEKKKKVLFSF